MARKTGRPANGESIGSYFRKVFLENPRLLRTRSNSYVIERWLSDHPGQREMPLNVRQNMANIKSVLRSRRRKHRAKDVLAGPKGDASMLAKRIGSRALESLEEGIDDSLTHARNLDRIRLDSVIKLLRRARNEVVWLQGE